MKLRQRSDNVNAWLPKLVKAMFIALIAVFIFILVQGAMFTGKGSSLTKALPAIGTVSLNNKKGMYYWINHYSDAQLSVRTKLDKWVVDAIEGCPESQSFCALSAETGQQGVRIIYSEQSPPLMKSDTPWFGGYINPVNGAVYDLFGRAYKFSAATTPASLPVVEH